MARAAEAEKSELVVDHVKVASPLDLAAEAGQGGVRDGTSRQLLDPPAALADQVGVMPGELLRQLVPKAAAGRVHGSQEA